MSCVAIIVAICASSLTWEERRNFVREAFVSEFRVSSSKSTSG